MQRAVITHYGVVVNTIVISDDANPATFGAVAAPDGVDIGWALVDGVWTAPTDGEPAPATTFAPLSPWQFQAALAIAGLDTALVAAIAAMTDPTAKAVAKAKLEYSGVYLRSDPLFDQLGALVGKTPEDIDAIWAQAAALA